MTTRLDLVSHNLTRTLSFDDVEIVDVRQLDTTVFRWVDRISLFIDLNAWVVRIEGTHCLSPVTLSHLTIIITFYLVSVLTIVLTLALKQSKMVLLRLDWFCTLNIVHGHSKGIHCSRSSDWTSVSVLFSGHHKHFSTGHNSFVRHFQMVACEDGLLDKWSLVSESILSLWLMSISFCR